MGVRAVNQRLFFNTCMTSLIAVRSSQSLSPWISMAIFLGENFWNSSNFKVTIVFRTQNLRVKFRPYDNYYLTNNIYPNFPKFVPWWRHNGIVAPNIHFQVILSIFLNSEKGMRILLKQIYWKSMEMHDEFLTLSSSDVVFWKLILSCEKYETSLYWSAARWAERFNKMTSVRPSVRPSTRNASSRNWLKEFFWFFAWI